jgi:hypothetical protein
MRAVIVGWAMQSAIDESIASPARRGLRYLITTAAAAESK